MESKYILFLKLPFCRFMHFLCRKWKYSCRKACCTITKEIASRLPWIITLKACSLVNAANVSIECWKAKKQVMRYCIFGPLVKSLRKVLRFIQAVEEGEEGKVSRRDRLWKALSINVNKKVAAIHVGSYLTERSSLFSVQKLWLNIKINFRFYWSIRQK